MNKLGSTQAPLRMGGRKPAAEKPQRREMLVPISTSPQVTGNASRGWGLSQYTA